MSIFMPPGPEIFENFLFLDRQIRLHDYPLVSGGQVNASTHLDLAGRGQKLESRLRKRLLRLRHQRRCRRSRRRSRGGEEGEEGDFGQLRFPARKELPDRNLEKVR